MFSLEAIIRYEEELLSSRKTDSALPLTQLWRLTISWITEERSGLSAQGVASVSPDDAQMYGWPYISVRKPR